MTQDELAAIRARADAATPGPWVENWRDIPALLDEVERLRVENARLRAALEAVEYADMESRCPWCGNWYNKGHAPNCQRQVALGR